MLIMRHILSCVIGGFSHCKKYITFWLHTFSSSTRSTPGRQTGKYARGYAGLSTTLNVNKVTEIH
jgi:hypothetical protein